MPIPLLQEDVNVLISKCWQTNPDDRPDIKEVNESLNQISAQGTTELI
jgi:hypothetical protein